MITKHGEYMMTEMHNRLITKQKHPNLTTLIDFYWESTANLTKRFMKASCKAEKDQVMMEHIEAFVNKAKELDVDDIDLFMAYIAIMKTDNGRR